MTTTPKKWEERFEQMFPDLIFGFGNAKREALKDFIQSELAAARADEYNKWLDRFKDDKAIKALVDAVKEEAERGLYNKEGVSVIEQIRQQERQRVIEKLKEMKHTINSTHIRLPEYLEAQNIAIDQAIKLIEDD